MEKQTSLLKFNKKAQLFLFAAAILVIIALGMIQTQKHVAQNVLFTEYVDNYLKEAPLAASTESFISFNKQYREYVHTKDAAIGFVGVVSENNITVYNGFEKTITINNAYVLSKDQSVSFVGTTVDVVFDAHQFAIPVRKRSVTALFMRITPEDVRFVVQ